MTMDEVCSTFCTVVHTISAAITSNLLTLEQGVREAER